MDLSIDIETYSDVELTKCGVYAYADSPNFTILLLAYAFDDQETKIVDLACGEFLPKEVLDALTDENITKTAFNAAFERTCLSRYLGAISLNNFIKISSSLINLLIILMLLRFLTLAFVINFSATLLNSLALGTVVVILSCFKRASTIFLYKAFL